MDPLHDRWYQSQMMALRELLITLSKSGASADMGAPAVARRRRQILAHVGAPLSTFRGTVKQVPADLLNELAKIVLNTVFPTFSNTVPFDPESTLDAAKRDLAGRHEAFLDTLTEILAEENAREERQERRYAGDRNMPRGRYFTVCNDPSGDDSQTLCKELFAYIDSSVPGWAFAGDPWDAELYQALGGDGLPDAYRNCVYVMLMEPLDEREQAGYQRAYQPVLDHLANPHGLKLLPIPVRWYDVEIPDVLDMRRPGVQDWLFRFFRAGDGAVLLKPAAPAGSFFEMLPALYHPYRGGSGVTAGIGSWLRIMGVNGLIFPSARSDAMIQVDPDGELVEARGWNLVLYAGSEATPDRQVHADSNPWYGFEDAGYQKVEIHQDGPSWRLRGIEAGYAWTRELMLAALQGGGGVG